MEEKVIQLFFTGDLVNNINSKDFIDIGLKKVISNSDISFFNLEGPEVENKGNSVHQDIGTIKYSRNVYEHRRKI